MPKGVHIIDLKSDTVKNYPLKKSRKLLVKEISLRDHISPLELKTSIEDTDLIRKRLSRLIQDELEILPKQENLPVFKVLVDLEIEPGCKLAKTRRKLM